MKISIVIPCYNLSQYLEEAVNSVLLQSYSDWECIIVDDGSTDSTSLKATELVGKSDKIRFYYKDNGGLSSARNYGIERAEGELILPLDADDIIAPTFLEKAVERFVNEPGTKIVYSNVRLFGELNEDWPDEEFVYEKMFWRNQIPCTAMYWKEDWQRTGGYRENMLGGFEDWDFWISLLYRSGGKGVIKLREPLFLYRQRPASMAREIDWEKAAKLKSRLAMNNLQAFAEMLGDPMKLSLEKDDLFRQLKLMEGSRSYKLGKALLWPFRILNKVN